MIITVDGSPNLGEDIMNRINAVYGRQSVDKKDSISIES